MASNEPDAEEPESLIQGKRSDSPEPGCASVKSDGSIFRDINFREGDGSTEPSLILGKRSESSKPGCASVKSDDSIFRDINFREGGGSTKPSLILGKRSESSEPGCVSVKSDDSIFRDINFREEDGPTEPRHNNKRPKLDSKFQELELKIISLVQNELKMFEELLSPDYVECVKREIKELSSVREAVLKIVLHVLRSMNQSDLTNTLQSNLALTGHQKLKSTLREKCQKSNEGLSNQGTSTLLNEIYTELYITEGGNGEVNNEHEMRQIERASRRPATLETPIKCNNLFKGKAIRTVMTKGVAGIGKTVSAQKFILDWAEGKANQDIHFIFPLPFRELNLIKEQKLSLIDLLQYFFTDTEKFKPRDYYNHRVLFIFDGLDESRLPLDFQNNENLSDVTQSTSVDVLLTNLMKGNLLPSALLWITSRPAAANQIPPECVDQITEIRGFSDPQKEQYFRKKINDQYLAHRIITHMKSSRSLYIMCHIPVFCWISATVLERMLGEAESGEIPKSLTQMFTHFLIFQIKHSSQKYQRQSDPDHDHTRKIIWALGKLAFQQLENGNLIFYEEDLRECGIDVREVTVNTGLCTQIFREEFGLHLGKVFSFVHLSVQEFLAAVFAFLSFISQNRNVLEQQTELPDVVNKSKMTDFLKYAVDQTLQSKHGHLDLFLRFLLGLSLESNQNILRAVLPQTACSSHNEGTVEYIKEKIRENPSPEISINLFHCLNELNDHSLVQEVQTYLSRRGNERLHGAKLSPAQWSALAFVLLNTDKELDEFDLSKYDKSEECFQKLFSVVSASKKAVGRWCNLTEKSCAVLASAFSSTSSSLRELDLSYNELQDSGVKLLSAGLEDAHCKLEILGLCNCDLTKESCVVLASALNSSCLRELDLSYNKLQDSGVKLLSAGLENSQCKLEKLMLCNCCLTKESCAVLASALSSNSSGLKELHLSCNELQDTGIKLLSVALNNPQCKLKSLGLRSCNLTVKSCATLFLALRSDSSNLRELDLSHNELRDSGVKLLYAGLKNQCCKVEKVGLSACNLKVESCAALASALRANSSSLRELDLSNNKLQDSGVKLLSAGLKNSNCKLKKLELSNISITEEGCAALVKALKSNPYHLRELNLNNSRPKDLSMKLLSDLLKNPHCKMEKLQLSGCSITEKGCNALVSALKSNPSYLRELNLNNSEPGESGVKELSDLLKDPQCKLEKLQLSHCSIKQRGCAALASALKLNPTSCLRQLNLNYNYPGESGLKDLSDLLEDPHCKLEMLDIML